MTAILKDPLNLVIAGVGGQGNILLSRLVGRALVKKGYFVSIGETFGAAQRGGAVMSNIRISKKMSLGPLIPEGKVHIILSLEPLETLRILIKFNCSSGGNCCAASIKVRNLVIAHLVS